MLDVMLLNQKHTYPNQLCFLLPYALLLSSKRAGNYSFVELGALWIKKLKKPLGGPSCALTSSAGAQPHFGLSWVLVV